MTTTKKKMMIDDPTLDKLIADEMRALDLGHVEAAELYARALSRTKLPPPWLSIAATTAREKEDAIAVRLWDLKHGMLDLSAVPLLGPEGKAPRV